MCRPAGGTVAPPPEGGAVVPAAKRKPQWAGAAGPARKRRQSPRVINGALEATCVVCFVLMSNEVMMPLYGPVYPPQANDPEPVGSGGGLGGPGDRGERGESRGKRKRENALARERQLKQQKLSELRGAPHDNC